MQHDMNVYQPVEIRTGKGFFRFYFHHFYSSNQVERFRLLAKKRAKTIVLEKRLFNSYKPWKIIEGEVTTKDPRDAAMTLLYVTKQIELYLEKYYKLRMRASETAQGAHVVYFDHGSNKA